uniref:Uncharacterized protein n=1 Tax=Anguilla anguilla TaxID=7936 RepID=A0A0E9V0Q3_ANGAN
MNFWVLRGQLRASPAKCIEVQACSAFG